MKNPQKDNKDDLLREWYRPTKRGARARQILMDEHSDYFSA